MYTNADYKRLEPYLDYAFDKATVYPSNAENLKNYSVDDEYIEVKRLRLTRFYLLRLIHMCNPKFILEKNESKVKNLCTTYQVDGNKRIVDITLTPDQLIELLYFTQGRGIQNSLF